MTFPDEGGAIRATGLLDSGIDGTVQREGMTIQVSSDRGPHILVEVLRRFDGDGLEPTTLAVREPSLDDVFLALTGRHEPSRRDNERCRMSSTTSVTSTLDTIRDHRVSLGIRATRWRRATQPDAVPARPAAARLLDDPAGDLRADVPVRVRRRDGGAGPRASTTRLPDGGHLRADRGVGAMRGRDRPRDRHEERSHGAHAGELRRRRASDRPRRRHHAAAGRRAWPRLDAARCAAAGGQEHHQRHPRAGRRRIRDRGLSRRARPRRAGRARTASSSATTAR